MALGLAGAFLLINPLTPKIFTRQIDKFEMASRDLRMALRPPRKMNDNLIVIGFTDLDHFLYGEEIDSREAYQILLQTLRRWGAQAVLFDILFEHPKPMDSILALKLQEMPTYISYKFLGEAPPLEPLEKELTGGASQPSIQKQTLEDDRMQLLDGIDQMDNLSRERDGLIINPDESKAAELDRAIHLQKFKVNKYALNFFEKRWGMNKKRFDRLSPPAAPFAVLPSPLLFVSAGGVGFINVVKEGEEVVRRAPFFIKHKDRIYPHLDLVFLCDYYGVNFDELNILPDRIEFHPKKNASAPKKIPIDSTGKVLVNFREGDPFLKRNAYPLHQILHYAKFGEKAQSRIKPEVFKDAIILVGELNPGGSDMEPIPIAEAFPMVGLHAAIINMVLNDDYIRAAGKKAEAAITIALGILMGLLFFRLDYKKASLIAFVILAFYSAVAYFAFNGKSFFLPYARPAGTIVLSYIILIFYIVGIKERERRRVRNVFLKSVSPKIGEEILRNYDNEAIWGSKKNVTILFADIRGFTSLSEEIGAKELVDFLDVYYDTLSQIIFQYDGVVNKFMGDAVMAIFGAPLELTDAEFKALRTALDMQSAVADLNALPILVEKSKKIALGIGICSGDVVVGTVGRKKIRIEYTALGDTVNVAERLESNAPAGDIYINDAACKKIASSQNAFLKENNINFEPLPPMMVKGRAKPVSAWRVVGLKS
ncbi:MAG: Adenylate cyclase 2 [candidate division BRC1 bacterium ADurb.Bin183]|nr:MAG: Adenylate cyclase 2 [candidate division BRC1 bacterium ADurb.Bin183]